MVRSRRALVIVSALAALASLAPGAPAGASRGDDPPQTTGDCEQYVGADPAAHQWDVKLAYIHALERCPSFDEVGYWIDRRRTGLTRLQLAESIDRSTESLDQIVDETYERADIEGEPTSEQRASFHTSLRATRSLTPVLAALLASDAYVRTHGLFGKPRRWVEAAFLVLLGRGADEAAQDFYVQTYDLETEDGRARVVTAILRSAEFRRLWVTQAFVSILGRQPDAGGLAYWDGWLRAGRGRERHLQLRSLILASDEGHALATCPVTC